MAQNNKSYKELLELQGAGAGAATSNQMLDLIMNRKPASYDPTTDPAAQAARKAAARNARAVTQDTMGQYAGMTGGVPSTAAVSAAAQAGNQAMAAGADKVAELEQMYLDRYNQETQGMYNAYGALQQAEADAFNRQMQQEQWQYQKDQADYEKQLAMAQLKASYGDLSGLKALGVDTSKYQSGGSGGGYRGSGGGSGGSGGNGGGGGGTGLSDEAFNMLLMSYPSQQIPQSEWAALAAQYGESALIAAGFSKKATQQTQTGSSSGGRKPNLPPDPRKGLGGTGMGTRD